MWNTKARAGDVVSKMKKVKEVEVIAQIITLFGANTYFCIVNDKIKGTLSFDLEQKIADLKHENNLAKFAQHTLDNTAEIAIWLEVDQPIINYINSKGAQYLEWDSKEVIGKDLSIVDPFFDTSNWKQFVKSIKSEGVKRFEAVQVSKSA